MSRRPIAVALAFKEPPPSSVDAGSAFPFSVAIEWPPAMSPVGASYALRESERELETGAMPKAADDGSIALTLCAPEETGEHHLSFILTSAKQEAAGSLSFTLTTVPHETSLAVWDVPSPVVRDARFEIKAGAKCTSACGLGGKIIEIRDEAGELRGSGALGSTALPGTTALSFTTIALEAPRKLALHAWTASFAPSELKLAHGSATSRFTFLTVEEPAHSVSITVVQKDTKEPVAGAEVRIGVYGAQTDDTGSARVRVPKGTFPLVVARVGYRMPERKIEVAKDIRVRIAAEKLPPPDPFALWSG